MASSPSPGRSPRRTATCPAASILDLARSMTRLPPFADLGRELLDLSEATRAAEHVQRRGLVMGLVERILGALPGPTMLSFEDLQWTDDVSLEVIAELARQSRDRQLLLTGDYRTEEVAPGSGLRGWRARLITQRIAEEIRLEPLTEAETALMTTLILDTGLPAPREVAAAVFERTDGIPLHIEELLGALSAEARADGRAIRQAIVPDTIEDAVLARLAQRSPEAQAAARAGSRHRSLFRPGGPRRDHERAAGGARGAAPGARRPLRPGPARRARPVRLSTPAAARRALPDDPSLGAPPTSCPSRRVRRPARGSVRDPRVRPLRARRSPPPGIRGRARRRRRGRATVGPPGGLRAVSVARSPTSPTISITGIGPRCSRHMPSKRP